MSGRWYYADEDGDLVEFTDRVNVLNEPSVTTSAEQCAKATSTILVDDPDGAWDVVGHRLVAWEDDEATYKRIFTGYAYTRTIRRDFGVDYDGEVTRQWEVTLDDINALIWRKVMAGEDTDRPAETDVERIQWLLSTGEAGNIADTTTYVSTADPVDMDANPDLGYNGQMMQSVVDDCCQQSGKNAFMLDVFDDPDYVSAVWYGADSVATFTSDVQISNDPADIDVASDIYPPSGTTTLERDPSRVFSGVFGNYDGGYTYRSRAATIAEFANRDTISSWPNVKTLAKAQARGDRYLVTLASEEDVIKTTIRVTNEHVNDVRAGHRMTAKFTHLPGYEADTEFRVLQRTVTQKAPDHYDIELVLSPLAPATPAGTCTTTISATTAWEEGEHHDVFDTPSIVFAPTPTIASYPTIVIGAWAGMNQTEPVWRGTQTASVSGFTGWGNSRDGWTGDAASIALAGYKAVASGTAGNMTVTWTGGGTSSGAQSWNAVGLAFQTSATSPVQTGWQNGTGSTVTLGAAATAGNLFVLVRFIENGGAPGTISGWTLVESGTLVANVNTGVVQVLVRCVEESDDTVIASGESSFSHWSFLSEWAIT